MATFGNLLPRNATLAMDSAAVARSLFNLPENGVVESITAEVNLPNASYAAVRYGIYNSSDSLVAVTPAVWEVPSTGWQILTIPFQNPISLASGNYYLAVQLQHDSTQAGAIADASDAGIDVDDGNTWGTGIPNPFVIGYSRPATQELCVYATYSLPTPWRLNEPEDFSSNPKSERDFETNTDDGWLVFGSGFSLQSTDDIYSTSGNCGRMTYPSGFDGGDAPAQTAAADLSMIQTYFCMSWRVSENWQPHPSGTNKILFITTEGYGGGGDPAFLSYQTDEVEGRIVMRQQGPDIPYQDLGPNLTNVEPIPGQFMFIECIMTMNKPGKADGQLHMWVNGIKTTEYDDVQWVNAGYEFNVLKFEPTWGGIGGTVTNEMHQEISRLWFSYSDKFPAEDPEIISVNDDDVVRMGAQSTAITNVEFNAISGNISGFEISNINVDSEEITFSVANIQDGQSHPGFGVRDLILNDGEVEIGHQIIFNPPLNFDFVELVEPINQTIDGVVYEFDPPAEEGGQIIFDSRITTINADGTGTTTYTGSQILYYWSPSSDSIQSFELITGNGGDGDRIVYPEFNYSNFQQPEFNYGEFV